MTLIEAVISGSLIVGAIYLIDWWFEPFGNTEGAFTDFVFGAEDMPPPATGAILSRRQLRFCLTEGERLKIIGEEMLDFTLRDTFEKALADHDSRCQDYRYRVADSAMISEDLATDEEKIREDAIGRVSEWQKKVAERPEIDAAYEAIRTGVVQLNPAVPADMRLIQRRLAQLGFYDKRIDGVWGPTSEDALRAFKQDNGMGASATWDTTTQRRLFEDEGWFFGLF